MKENEIWTEKYRPKTFDDLVFDRKDRLKEMLVKENSMFPHLLLHSVSGGTGKGSMFNVISNTLKANVKIINASEHTGIDYIRDVVKNYASSISFFGNSRKLLFLDEVDGLSLSAFNILKGMMEKYQKNVIFVLSTNKFKKIPQPIVSRCVDFELKSPNKFDILKRLKQICELENVEYEESALKKLIDLYYPDMRTMVKLLQMFSENGSKKILEKDIKIESTYSKTIYDLIESGKIKKAEEIWLKENLDLVNLFWDFYLIYRRDYEDKYENKIKIMSLFLDTNRHINNCYKVEIELYGFSLLLSKCMIYK